MKNLESIEPTLEARECLEIILGAEEFFKSVSIEAEKITPDKFVDPNKLISTDEIFLSRMTESEKEKFSLFVFTKEKISELKALLGAEAIVEEEKKKIKSEIRSLENNKNMIRTALWIEIYFRLVDMKVDFYKWRLHLRSDFSIVKKRKDKISQPRDFHVFG